ncbi:MAG: hypothetical protein ACRED9_13260 [Caulobacteraceae bacterium]
MTPSPAPSSRELPIEPGRPPTRAATGAAQEAPPDEALGALPLIRFRREAFAWALAGGLAPRAAARAAGYAALRKANRLARASDIRARRAFLSRQLARGGGPDLTSVIDQLLDIAHDGVALGHAGGLTAARLALVEAARLKRLPPARGAAPPGLDAPPRDLETPLSDEEWLARHGPQAPGKGV